MESESEEIGELAKIFGLEKLCDLIAEAACDRFLEVYGREFLLSDACVSVEILDHIDTYNWAVGEKLFPNYLAIGSIASELGGQIKNGNWSEAWGSINKNGVYNATKSIDIREKDVKKSYNISDQANVFWYKEGLRDIYQGSELDPWADERWYLLFDTPVDSNKGERK